MEIAKGYHTSYSIKYHVVWTTKYRYLKFFGQVEKEAVVVFHQIASEFDWEIEEISVMPDHVHLYISTELTDRPCDVPKNLKGESSKILGKKYPYLKNRKGEIWARGYFMTTINDKTTAAQIKRYIQNQKKVAKQEKLF